LKQYRVWLEENQPDSPLLTELRAQSRHEVPPPPLAATVDSPDPAIATGSG
jgi:hypothetical protein